MSETTAACRPGTPSLTVLIPTRNRWPLLAAQVRSVHLLLSEGEIEFEIVVHDNSTTTSPRGLIESFSSQVRYIKSPEAYDTAEENICEALRHCRGEYVWLLADDDGVEPAGVRELARLIESGEHDIIVFNSRHGRDERLAGHGAYVTERARRLFYEKEMVCSISTFVERTGFFYWLCAISTVVVRRSVADPKILSKYIGIARIYAHVAWLIEIGRDRRFLFVNRPLVVYGLLPTDHDGGRHWRSVGIREGGYAQSVWTGLWLRVLDELVAQEAITLDQVRRTVDMNHTTRFHFGANLAYQALQQLGEMPEIVPSADLAIISRWLLHLFPGAIFLTALIDDIAAFGSLHHGSLLRIEQDSRCDQAVRALARDLRERAAWWRRAIGDTPWYTRFYVETLHLYDVYDLGADWVAAHAGFGGLSQALEVIDLPNLPPVFFRASSYGALRQLIEAQPLAPEGLESVRSAAFQVPGEWERLQPERSQVRVDLVPGPPPPSLSPPDAELTRLQDELVRQDMQLADIYGSRVWRLAGWLRRLGRPTGKPLSPAGELALGARILFAEQATAAYLVRGFSTPEPWGRWTDGRVAVFRCRHPAVVEPGLLEIWPVMAWTAGETRPCMVDLVVNGGARTRVHIQAEQPFSVSLSAADMAVPELEIVLNITRPKTDREEPIDDRRALGIGIEALRLSRRGDVAPS